MSAGDATTAIVLCGGGGTRLGGVDKPLLELAGKPLVGHVIERLQPQVDAIVLSCRGGRDDAYRRFGWPVIPDQRSGEGPLGGIASAVPHASTPWLLTTPGDTPFLPHDLVSRLTPACRRRGAAVVAAGDRRQNLTMLLDSSRAQSLVAFFAAGGRAAHRWLDANDVEQVRFSEAAFLNVNTPTDMRHAQRRLERSVAGPAAGQQR